MALGALPTTFTGTSSCGVATAPSLGSSDVDNSRAARFDMELDGDAIRRTLSSLDLERMAAEVEMFAAALSRDLIEPADFAG